MKPRTFATALFVASVFESAFLLFLVQPIVARMALPLFGGGPAIWNTALLFFQALLLAGYAWAHFGPRLLGERGHLVAHVLVLLVPLATLPPWIAARAAPEPGRWPVLPLLGALLVAAGPAFFALSTNASLAQRLFARRTAGARDPYFLYAASNAGSLFALVAYPLVVEPALGLRAQALAWSAGYALFALLALAQIALAWRATATPAPSLARAPLATPRAQRARWLFRSAVTSLLLLAVTFHIASDVASVPLLWTAPLALYLLSYVLAFLPRLPHPRALLELVAMYCVAFGMNVWPFTQITALAWVLIPPLGALFFGAWVVHTDLARDRPAPEALSQFYLYTAAGGCLGGLFASLLAPLVFRSVAEYPIALGLLAVALAFKTDQGASLARALRSPRTYAGPVLAALVAVASVVVAPHARWPASLAWLGLPAILLLVALVLWRTTALFAGVAVVVALVAASGLSAEGSLLAAERDFFGVLRVRQVGALRTMTHGSTLHGVQQTAPLSRTPGTYYHPATPMGWAVAHAPDGARIAVVGLGTGSLAELLRPGQSMVFYELDPAVEPMARRYFTFLGDSPGDVRVVDGDARLALASAPRAGHALVIVDAFSSDAIPVHLLTVEAVRMYLELLRPDGVLLLHVSHRYLDLTRVLAGDAAQLGLAAAVNNYAPTPALEAQGVRACTVVALARDRASIERLGDAGWVPLRVRNAVTWTDDRSSLLDVLVR